MVGKKQSQLTRTSPYDVFSDFEGTIVSPEISYKDWALPRTADHEAFKADYDSRMERVRRELSPEAWKNYLELYTKIFSIEDFKEISSKYEINKIFESWCTRFLKAHDYNTVNLIVISRGFAPIIRYYFERQDVKRVLKELKIFPRSIIASEPFMDKNGLVKGLKTVVYSKRKFVRDGHVMLGDESEEREFGNYPYFVNLSKLKHGE